MSIITAFYCKQATKNVFVAFWQGQAYVQEKISN